MLCHLPKFSDPNLIVGFDTSDDASVYKINESTALIQTVDIFPPVVDDPYEYGKIAAANSLSDVYAMGGEPKLALNIFCFPENLPRGVVKDILQGGYEKVQEAGAIITGGHTIQDSEPKYGLSVTGFIHPNDVITNGGIKEGDVLILTKPLGTGIITTAAKASLADYNVYSKAIESMAQLNKGAALVMKDYNVDSCTDVTGFGLLGHVFEMAYSSGCTVNIDHSRIPLLPGAAALAEEGIIPAGAYKNREYLKDVLCIDKKVPLAVEDCLFDPQTSGGLIISVPEKESLSLLHNLQNEIPCAEIIGYAEALNDYSIVIK